MNAATCIICFTPFSEELEIVSLKCHHCFHRNCIKEWFKIRTSCPQCRKEVHPFQLYKVILSFETTDPIAIEERSDSDKLLIESQDAKINDLTQQIRSRDLILEDKMKEHEKALQSMQDEIDSRDEIMNQVASDKDELEMALPILKLSYEDETDRHKQEVLDLKKELDAKEEIITELRQSNDHQRDKISKLRNQLEKARVESFHFQVALRKISSLTGAVLDESNNGTEHESEDDCELTI